MTTQIMTRKEKLNGLRQTMQSDEFQKNLRGVLPKVITPQRFALTALSIVGRDENLLECTPVSLLRCMAQSAAVGLEIGNELGHAYLVPFRDKKRNVTICTLILGYRGIVQLLYRSGQISGVEAQVVRTGDEFDHAFGLNPKLIHTPKASITTPVSHAYAILRMKDGSTLFDVMTREEIEAIRTRSRAGASGPWMTDYAEMAKKTVLRRLAKLAPMSVEDQRVVTADERADANLDQHEVFAPEALQVTVEENGDEPSEPELTLEEQQAREEYQAEVAAAAVEDVGDDDLEQQALDSVREENLKEQKGKS
jgi:recombination protein RecT